ncbi:shikimate dehydrogenase [Herbaspirillum hiltneri N3]|uniref:shikimate dehydrogenase (NADP(+)) n=1 Tax=Herbaspirillum hiltneri N3 TaxID=1262470 RepID=A0ABM5UXJ1_9BURK|nr:shikimate dehydrogenase [Herbaspirillum hiltneri]AKZ61935.1 shikimate dehydrogenase [Herbaspirillum hiltneri N3]
MLSNTGRQITGSTKVVAILADPIGHVRTPPAFNALMAQHDVDAVMVPFNVRPDHFAQFIAAVPLIRSLAGLVVTIPYKEIILQHCTTLTESAQRMGAVNIVRFDDQPDGARSLIGSNFDGIGFVGGLLAQGHVLKGRRVYLAGAGGAAKAIVHALADEGVAAIGIYNRSAVRAEHLVRELRQRYPRLDAHLADARPQGYTLAINSTSLGLQESDPLPFTPDGLPPGAVVAEVIMKTEITPLLAKAGACGFAVHPGRHMMEVQIERMGQFLGLI